MSAAQSYLRAPGRAVAGAPAVLTNGVYVSKLEAAAVAVAAIPALVAASAARVLAREANFPRPLPREVRPFFFSSRRRHTRFKCDWSSDVCSSDLNYNAMLHCR